MYIRQGDRTIDKPAEMDVLCQPCGIIRDRWNVEALGPELCRQASINPEYASQILETFAEPLQAIKQQHGYLTEDIVSLSPETPNLDGILENFIKEHHHTDDEVRVILYGHGIFGIIPEAGEPFELHLEAGDLIIVPAYTRHWFTLKEDRQVVALRIFKTPDGCTAIYGRPTTSASTPTQPVGSPAASAPSA
jgi:1,2-dihydroxy-3-keto-5-methylthiopentene dioxygenase